MRELEMDPSCILRSRNHPIPLEPYPPPPLTTGADLGENSHSFQQQGKTHKLNSASKRNLQTVNSENLNPFTRKDPGLERPSFHKALFDKFGDQDLLAKHPDQPYGGNTRPTVRRGHSNQSEMSESGSDRNVRWILVRLRESWTGQVQTTHASKHRPADIFWKIQCSVFLAAWFFGLEMSATLVEKIASTTQPHTRVDLWPDMLGVLGCCSAGQCCQVEVVWDHGTPLESRHLFDPLPEWMNFWCATEMVFPTTIGLTHSHRQNRLLPSVWLGQWRLTDTLL